nr:aldehyde dehydrogenase family protein [Desulfobacula sp.]
MGIKPVNFGATTGSSKGWIKTAGKELVSYSPINGEPLAAVLLAGSADYETVMIKAQQAFVKFRMMPAPDGGDHPG